VVLSEAEGPPACAAASAGRGSWSEVNMNQNKGSSMRSMYVSICALSLCIAAHVARGAEVYVSPAGDDNNDGSITAPLATIEAARDKADQLKGSATPVTVFLRGGTYYLNAPIVFGPANSGTAQGPIVYTAYPGEKAVISGGIKVTSAWAVSSGQIMVTTIAPNVKVDQLFLNGKRQILARYPNFDSTLALDGFAAGCLSATRVALWSNPTEGPGYIRGLQTSRWGGESFIITGKNATNNTITQQWVGDNNRGSLLHASYRMVENIFEELDAPGEWYYSKPTGKLYFYPPAGADLGSAVIELASQDELIHIVGTSASKVQYLSFKGLTFTHTYRTLFSKTYEGILQSDWCLARAGCIFIQDAERIRVESCLFDQIGGNGIFMSGYNRNHVVYNNTFIDAGASCVLMVGLQSAVRCPSSWSSTPTCTDKTPGPLTADYPAFIRVDNNLMHHFGRFEKQTAGVDLSMTEMDTVRHNTIDNCPRAGINFTDGCWGGHVIEYNWVYKSVLETGDHGPFNAWGRDRNSRWPDDSSATQLDAMYPTIVRNNRFEGPARDFGIDLDDQASNYLQYNNLLIGGGLKLQWNRYNTYLNNIVVRGGNVQFHGVWTKSADYAARNIFVGPYIYGTCCFSTGANIPDTIKNNIRQFDSNVVYNSGNPPTVMSWPLDTTKTLYTWAQWQAAGLDVHSSIADPLFSDTTQTWANYAPRGDFSVKTGSPALALGFKNFPMDSFGVMQVSDVAIHYPSVNDAKGPYDARGAVHYREGRLFVSCDGDYRVTVLTAAGRTLKAYKGKGATGFAFSPQTGTGIYLAVVRTKNGTVTRRFMVN
jgi:hypothetical protein